MEDEDQRKRNNIMAELYEKQTGLKKIKQEIKDEEEKEEGSAAASSKERTVRGGFQKRPALRGKRDRQEQPLWFMCQRKCISSNCILGLTMSK